MTPDTLQLKNVGPIKEANITFGDLTVLVGPQATGKSVFLEFLKLLVDQPAVFRTMAAHGLNWNERWQKFFDLYFGEGMSTIWRRASRILWNGNNIDMREFTRHRAHVVAEARHSHLLSDRCFFIPAQRVLALTRDGWLRAFSDYNPGDPYVVRAFSERLRVLMETEAARALSHEIDRLIQSSILVGFKVAVDAARPQTRLVLTNDGSALPFMVWSAGQREFAPLLLSFHYLIPPKLQRGKWVVIEELEMGLHPKAIAVVLIIVLDLISRGYKVCLSTHSPHVLDLVWALRVFREHGAKPENVLDLFDVRRSPAMTKIAKAALAADTKVYFFDSESHTARDISALDPGSQRQGEVEWGGLTEFTGRVGDEVAKVVAESE